MELSKGACLGLTCTTPRPHHHLQGLGLLALLSTVKPEVRRRSRAHSQQVVLQDSGLNGETFPTVISYLRWEGGGSQPFLAVVAGSPTHPSLQAWNWAQLESVLAQLFTPTITQGSTGNACIHPRTPPHHCGPLEATQTGRRKQLPKCGGETFHIMNLPPDWKIPAGTFTQGAFCYCNLQLTCSHLSPA